MSLEKMLQDRYENKNAMSIEDIKRECLIADDSPDDMIVKATFAGECKGIRNAKAISYIIKRVAGAHTR